MKTSLLLIVLAAGFLSRPVAAADSGKSIFDFDDVPATTQPSPGPAVNPKLNPPLQPPATLPTQPVATIASQPDQSVVPVRLSPPGAAVQAELLKMVREIFEKQYAATARESRQTLARNLFLEASKIRKNHAARFVLLRESLEMAVVATDVTLCRQALETLDRFYKVNVASISQDAAIRVLKQAPPDDPAVVAWVADVAGQLVAAEQYDSARRLATMAIARPAARKNEGVLARLKAAQSAADEYEKVKPALAILRNKPDDPTANLTAGRFLVLMGADWSAGLRHLAKCNKPTLKEAAVSDLAAPASAAEQFDLAGLWWTLAREDSSLQARFEERAAYWYTRARPQLEELKRALADKRIADVASRTASSVMPAVKNGPVAPLARDMVLDLGNNIVLKVVRIPAGKFVMGSPETEKGRDKGETQHEVTITRPFYMGATEVTQEQYAAVVESTPSHLPNKTDPVHNVTWDDATAFCKRLSQTTGRTARLPTEAEWEYAARNEDTNLDKYAWYDRNSGKQLHPVGQKNPNALGLYDTQGNLWEWCQDWHGDYPSGPATDPTGPATGDKRVLRGGSFGSRWGDCRPANRSYNVPGRRNARHGFRIVVAAGAE